MQESLRDDFFMSNRGLSAGMTVHVIQRGNNKTKIFNKIPTY